MLTSEGAAFIAGVISVLGELKVVHKPGERPYVVLFLKSRDIMRGEVIHKVAELIQQDAREADRGEVILRLRGIVLSDLYRTLWPMLSSYRKHEWDGALREVMLLTDQHEALLAERKRRRDEAKRNAPQPEPVSRERQLQSREDRYRSDDPAVIIVPEYDGGDVVQHEVDMAKAAREEKASHMTDGMINIPDVAPKAKKKRKYTRRA